MRPLPPPPPLPTGLEASAKSNSVADGSTLMKDGDSAVDGGRSGKCSYSSRSYLLRRTGDAILVFLDSLNSFDFAMEVLK